MKLYTGNSSEHEEIETNEVRGAGKLNTNTGEEDEQTQDEQVRKTQLSPEEVEAQLARAKKVEKKLAGN